MWINVKFYDASMTVLSESGAYDSATGVLSHDAEVKIYEVKPGLDEVTAPLVGVEPGPSFHFVLNNKTFKDNRIPPRGFTNAAYASFGGEPVAYSYSDGEFWDETYYTVPTGAASAEVTLYYQSTSKEFVEFLRDENTTDSKGQEFYDLWNNNGKCPPEVMATTTFTLGECAGDADCDDGLYCNGVETCDLATNTCVAGTSVDCSDGVDCTIDSCNESTDTCDHAPDDAFCDNGLYCDGAEICDVLLGCQAGTPVDCDDGVECTIDSCNETTDTCDHVPDGCEPVCADLPTPGEPDSVDKSRYITLRPGPQTELSAIRVTLVDMHEFGDHNGATRWLGPPRAYREEDANSPDRTFIASRLQCEPYFHDWSTIESLHVFGGEVVPGSTYGLQTLTASCDEAQLGEDAFGAELLLATGVWGDATDPFAGSDSVQPDFTDISQIVQKFLAVPTAPIKAQTQLQPNVVFPDRAIDFRDIAAGVEAFLGTSYTDSIGASGPCTCPSTVICSATACTNDDPCGDGYCIDGFCTDACGRCSPGGQTVAGAPEQQVSGGHRALTGSVSKAVAARITLVPTRTRLAPGDETDIEVYLSGVSGLTMYQAALGDPAHRRDGLEVKDVRIETERSDYVFRGAFIPAADPLGMRAGAIHLTDAVDATEPVYLATLRVAASPRAAGEYTLDLGADASNFLATLNGASGLRTAEPIVISIERERPRKVDRQARSVR